MPGWVYLNILHPMVAWGCYRGVIASTTVLWDESGRPDALPLMTALRASDQRWLMREHKLEQVRQMVAPRSVPRIGGLFCFTDLQLAERALGWGVAFRTELLAEVEVHARAPATLVDARWLASPELPLDDESATQWMQGYWSGQPKPGGEPHWETIVDGRLVVCGTELRERAHRIVAAKFPHSLALLELSRLGACLGSEVGTINAYLRADATGSRVRFEMDERDVTSHAFRDQLTTFIHAGNPVDWDRLAPFFDQSKPLNAPDFGPYEKCLDLPSGPPEFFIAFPRGADFETSLGIIKKTLKDGNAGVQVHAQRPNGVIVAGRATQVIYAKMRPLPDGFTVQDCVPHGRGRGGH